VYGDAEERLISNKVAIIGGKERRVATPHIKRRRTAHRAMVISENGRMAGRVWGSSEVPLHDIDMTASIVSKEKRGGGGGR
jgi:hypothetical protein